MASNSKKRRRVLGVSCILAALIIASSSFAWFTSKDEVTNRLTASSDYGVSIVESFMPPVNWLPGEEVNKDVYAVNTGAIDAFVKEDVTGVLNYTFESKVNAWDSTCLELGDKVVEAIDGATTNEAGGYLAYTDSGEKLGPVNSARTNDGVEDTWHPTKTGVYIFRRGITHGSAGDTLHPTDDTFTYAGYYYKAKTEDPDKQTPGDGKYYKIVIGDDDFRTNAGTKYEFDITAPETAMTENGAVIDKATGKVKSGAPKIWYVKETRVEDQRVDFKYEAEAGTSNSYDPDTEYSDTNHPARLVVEYSKAVNPSTGTYDATADAARKQVDLVNKKGKYDQDLTNYEQALADYNYALALATARDELQAAAAAMDTAASSASSTQSTLDSKWTALFHAAKDDENAGTETSLKEQITALSITGDNDGTSGPDLCPDKIMTAEVLAVLNADQAAAGPHLLDDVQTNYEELKNLWSAIQGDINSINSALDKYTGIQNAKITPAEAEAYQNTVNRKLDDLSTLLGKYKAAYADLEYAIETASDLQWQATPTTKTNIEAKKTAIDSGDVATAETAFDTAVREYVNAYNANTAAQNTNTSTAADWDAAKAKYNKDVTAAQKAYNDVVLKVSGKPQPGDTDAGTDGDQYVEYVNNSAELVTKFSARRGSQTPEATDPNHGANYDPTLDATATFGEAYHGNDYEYYKTLVYDSTGTAPIPKLEDGTTAGGKIREVPDSVHGIDTDDNLFNYETRENTAGNTKTVKSLYDIIGDGTTAGSYKDYLDAKAAYEAAKATAEAGSKIKIYVNLADGYDAAWQYAGDADANGTTASTPATFYYKKILESGKTSEKLIDSVTFDKDVSPVDYKNLTFDLNVVLDSAQVTYDDHMNVTTTAVDANNKFTKQIDTEHPVVGTAFNWIDATPASNPIYRLDTDTTEVTVDNNTVATGTNNKTDYPYTVTKNGKTYYGTEIKEGATFVYYDTTTSAFDNTDKVVLHVS